MSDLGMDPEIINLYLQAKGGKSDTSFLNSLNNPWLTYLAGAYDPMSQQAGGAGSLWASYANNPDYPVVQDIIKKIEGGADPYYISSYIDGLVSNGTDLNGFQDADLKGLAKGLYNEYTGKSSGSSKGGGGGAGGGNWWSKAGLRNPTDVYTTADVPLNADIQRMMVEQQLKSSNIKELKSKADSSVDKARKKLSPMYGKRFDTQQLIDYLKNDPEGQKIAKKNNIDWSKVDTTTGQVFSGPISDDDPMYTGWQAFSPWGALGNVVKKGVAQVGRTAEIIGKENIMGGKAKYIEDKVGFKAKENPYDVYAYEQAKLDQEALGDQQRKAAKLDEATRRGALRAFTEAGRTPTRDQMSTVLKFLKNT
jgi:hypothetical protein